MENKDLKKEIIRLSYKHKLSHLGSCLSSVDIINHIFENKDPKDRFVLSNGHAGLAYYVVLEKYGYAYAEELLEKHGIHPSRDPLYNIDVSTGSLGQGLPIAVGMALANRDRMVYCVISDGECAEGSIWEALHIAERNNLTNLEVHVVANGFGAYTEISIKDLIQRLNVFYPEIIIHIVGSYEFPFLEGIDAHYHVMNEDEFNYALEIIENED